MSTKRRQRKQQPSVDEEEVVVKKRRNDGAISMKKTNVINSYVAAPNAPTEQEQPVFIIHEVEEVVEHICARCEKEFPSIKSLKEHLPDCLKNRNAINGSTFLEPKDPEIIVSLDLNTNSIVAPEVANEPVVEPEDQRAWEQHNDPNSCFCCGEGFEFCHVGHIKCKQCPKSFRTEEALSRHRFILHSTNSENECQQCNAVCASFAFLTLHLEAHKTGKPFSCKRCGRDFTRKFHLDRHLKYLNCDGTRPTVKHCCPICKAAYARIDNLKEHMLQHENPTEKSKDFQCPHCPKAFIGSSLLNIHIRTHTKEKPFICDICKTGFPSNAALRKHRRTHTGEKPYECPHCQDRFAARETLNRHKKRHTGDMKYVCSFCPSKFIQNSQLKNHMKMHDSTITFDCKECNEKCPTIRALAIHKRNAHGIGVTYNCNYCEKIFVTKSERQRHELGIHLHRRDHKCEKCQKAFVTVGQLRVHENVHRIEPPVRCKLCKRVVARRDTYRRHMKSQHADEFKKIIARAEARKMKTDEMVEETPETVEIDPNVEIEYVELVDIDEYAEVQNKIEFEGLADQIPNMEVRSALSDTELKEIIVELLEALLDGSTLDEFNHPVTPVDEVLVLLIESCGNKPFEEEGADKGTELRENVKSFLSLVMEGDHIQTLLNNHTVDETVQYILKYVKADY